MDNSAGPTSPPPPPPAAGGDCPPPNERSRLHDVEQPLQNCDWISTLPDDTLIKILSLMTVREAAVTGCLSTRWRHLWKNVDRLILDAHTFGMQEPEISNYHENPDLWNAESTKFVHKVNGLLHHHNGIGIKEFTITFPLTSAHASELDRWIGFAAAACTKKLCLHLCDKHGKATTQFAEPYVLCLSNCSLGSGPANLNGFSYLHTLSLSCLSMADAVVLDIISSCCALRQLFLRKCHQLIHVRISHAQLQSLGVNNCNSLVSISIHAEKLERFYFWYMDHKVNIEYECVPLLHDLSVYLVKKNECPLDCIGALPNLKTLTMQFPTHLQVSPALQQNVGFARLTKIVLFLLTPWRESICSVAYLLKAAPLVETFRLKVCSKFQPPTPSKLNITWPEDFTLERLSTIRIEGFSGEAELMELLSFLLSRAPILKTLLIDTHAHEGSLSRWHRKQPEDAMRCYLAKEMASIHLIPKVPSTVELRVI